MLIAYLNEHEDAEASSACGARFLNGSTVSDGDGGQKPGFLQERPVSSRSSPLSCFRFNPTCPRRTGSHPPAEFGAFVRAKARATLGTTLMSGGMRHNVLGSNFGSDQSLGRTTKPSSD